MGGTVFMALGGGRQPPPRNKTREREARERETGYEPFALHAPIHWAIRGGRSKHLGVNHAKPE